MKIIGLDIETTDLDWNKGAEIIQFCAKTYDLESRNLISSFNQKFNPDAKIAPSAQKVHGISKSDLIGMPSWKNFGAGAVNKLLAESNGFVAHNGFGFDYPFVDDALKKAGFEGIPIDQKCYVDTMLDCRWATYDGRAPSLKAFCEAVDVEYDTELAHDAEYDVDVMMKAFFRGYDWGFIELQY